MVLVDTAVLVRVAVAVLHGPTHCGRGSVANSTLELADLVLEKVQVAFVPGEAFGAPGYARFSFALGDDDLVEGISRIAKLVAG